MAEMTAGELTEWTAYEQVYGSVLVHERIDAGFAMIGYLIAKAFSDGKRTMTVRDFMPEWYRELTKDAELQKSMAWLKGLARAND